MSVDYCWSTLDSRSEWSYRVHDPIDLDITDLTMKHRPGPPSDPATSTVPENFFRGAFRAEFQPELIDELRRLGPSDEGSGSAASLHARR